MKNDNKKGFYFTIWRLNNLLDKLFGIFKELINGILLYSDEVDWLRELDVEYKLTDEQWATKLDDFIEDLKKKRIHQDEVKKRMVQWARYHRKRRSADKAAGVRSDFFWKFKTF
jgi:hypothetical protein